MRLMIICLFSVWLIACGPQDKEDSYSINLNERGLGSGNDVLDTSNDSVENDSIINNPNANSPNVDNNDAASENSNEGLNESSIEVFDPSSIAALTFNEAGQVSYEKDCANSGCHGINYLGVYLGML